MPQYPRAGWLLVSGFRSEHPSHPEEEAGFDARLSARCTGRGRRFPICLQGRLRTIEPGTDAAHASYVRGHPSSGPGHPLDITSTAATTINGDETDSDTIREDLSRTVYSDAT